MWCPSCRETIGLRLYMKMCRCRKARGHYNEDGDTVTVSQGAVLFGFCNHLKNPQAFSEDHLATCSNAWPYPENEKVTRM